MQANLKELNDALDKLMSKSTPSVPNCSSDGNSDRALRDEVARLTKENARWKEIAKASEVSAAVAKADTEIAKASEVSAAVAKASEVAMTAAAAATAAAKAAKGATLAVAAAEATRASEVAMTAAAAATAAAKAASEVAMTAKAAAKIARAAAKKASEVAMTARAAAKKKARAAAKVARAAAKVARAAAKKEARAAAKKQARATKAAKAAKAAKAIGTEEEGIRFQEVLDEIEQFTPWDPDTSCESLDLDECKRAMKDLVEIMKYLTRVVKYSLHPQYRRTSSNVGPKHPNKMAKRIEVALNLLPKPKQVETLKRRLRKKGYPLGCDSGKEQGTTHEPPPDTGDWIKLLRKVEQMRHVFAETEVTLLKTASDKTTLAASMADLRNRSKRQNRADG
jgi:hypothetical protein